ncbi:peptide-N-glycosidase F-related protein [Vulgatibacter sp.]|uniref:peptide-N-glycosidase F-related protein n=1 Tax=Vulgatibacter sp. TaxID=1971226 RepID=UPI003567032A
MSRWSASLVACAWIAAACGSDNDSTQATCEPACLAGQDCVDGACVGEPLPDADGDGVPDESDRCGSTATGSAVDESGCSWAEAPVPLPEGPYGTGIRDAAGDFTVQTLGGSFAFHASWTGNDSHLFLVRAAGNAYSDAIAGSDVGAFLAESPANVHYLFLDVEDDEAARRAAQEAMLSRFEEALALLDPAVAAQWRTRLHFVTDAVDALDGSLGAFFAAHPNFAFGIDRFGRWREAGSLYDFNDGAPHLRFLAREAVGFDYERRLEREMGAIAATEVVVFDGDRHQGGWEAGHTTSVEITLPSAAEMARFDSMAVYLYTACPGHLQGLEAGCNEWDYAHHLFVCDEEDPASCDTELVRYVTPYGREGEWLTDVSPLLPLFANGGSRTLKYTGANGYDMHLRILLWDAGKQERPVEVRFLYGASGAIPWNEEYNGRFEPVKFTVDDPTTTRVGIYNVVTGHGFGSTWENCAEFCDSEHEFAVNGTAFSESHPEAKDRYGCFARVDQGVVPNQFGSWPFGRAGWCPGQDVKPWVQDVSDVLVSGENEIAYRALFRGEPYVPRLGGGGDYLPELRLQSWLVRYERK